MAVVDSPRTTRILVVENELGLVASLACLLQAQGYGVELAMDSVQAKKALATMSFDLVVLGAILPQGAGLGVLRELRSARNYIPVLVLSTRSRVTDRIDGLRLGADDYLPRPFDSSEFLARVGALLRRSLMNKAAILTTADLKVDLVAHTVTRGGRAISLSPREFDLLVFLVRNKNTIVTRRKIAEEVWGCRHGMSDSIVPVYIRYLRKKMDTKSARTLIRTVLKKGYVLIER